MTIDELRSKKIGILGWGVNHRAMTGWLVRHGVTGLAVLDEGLTEAAREDSVGVSDWRFGPTAFDHLGEFDLLFRSPGIPLGHPKLALGKDAGAVLTSQTALFLDHCPAKTIGVTGTNGKGTTASLIHAMLEAGSPGGRAYLAGNIGRDPFEFLDELTVNDWVVLELSSFQLEDVNQSPHIAVVLAITPDHLEPTRGHPNHHASPSTYHAAKRNLVAHQQPTDVAILSADDPVSASFATKTQAVVRWFSQTRSVDSGVTIADNNGVPTFQLVAGSQAHWLLPVVDLQLRGPHNWQNVAAALTAGATAGVSNDVLAAAARSFRALPNRLEDLGEINGVTYVNDSYATSPVPTIAAIRSFRQPVVLLLGGQGKGADYAALMTELASSTVRAVICYGAEGERFEQLLHEAHFGHQILYERSFDGAVRRASSVAQPDDVVLLSPSATSFDQFRSYTERGDRFRQLVTELRHGA